MRLKVEINTVRDDEGREVDFLLVQEVQGIATVWHEIKINGVRVPPNFSITVRHRVEEGAEVLLDGGRTLFPTEVYRNGDLVASVPGLLPEDAE